jgi:hypothetical protein
MIFNGLYHQDKLVTSTVLYIDDNVAGIYLVGTLPEFQNHGFGTKIGMPF